MNYPSLRNIICKSYCKPPPRSSSSRAYCGPPCGRGGLLDEFVRPPEPIVPHICRGQVDLDQRCRGAYPCVGEQDRGYRVSLEVGVALLHQTGRDARDLAADLGDGQRYVGGLREGIFETLTAGLRVRFLREAVS